MDANTLARCTSSTALRAAPYAEPLTLAMDRFGINTPARTAAFLANVAVETLYLRAVEEDLTYTTPDRLRAIFPSLFVPPRGKYRAEEYVRQPAALSRLKYGGFHGRGLMHLTWEDAYRDAGAALGFDYVGDPALVMEPQHAALTACWFWADYKQLNPFADRGDIYEIRGRVNGLARLGLAETKAQLVVAAKVLGA